MLGNSYEHSAAGDYDPESPRPNGVTGTLGPSSVVPGGASGEGGSQFGSASRGVFGPPPLPSVNPPIHSAFAPTAGRFMPSAPPGLPSATVGSAVPLWPPSKIPTLSGKPPRTFSGHSQQSQATVSRTTSLQSDFGVPRLSNDDFGAVKPNDFAPGAHGLMPQQYSHQDQGDMNSGGAQISNDIRETRTEDSERIIAGQFSSHENQVYGWQQQHAPEDSQMPSFGQDADFSGLQEQDKKKPPPAIAKESPLKALYAKGGERHLEGRRRISLNASLDAAALPEDKPGYMLPGSQSIFAPESSTEDQGAHTGSIGGATNISSPVLQHSFGTTVAPLPRPQPEEKTHGFNHEPPGFQAFQPSAPQVVEPLSTNEEQHSNRLHHEVSSKNKGSRKRKGFWPGKRTFIICILVVLYFVLNPYNAMKHVTVASIGVHAWLSGFLLSPIESYHGMKAEYDTLTSAHTEWSTMIHSIYSHSYQASETSWDIVERKIVCDTNKQVCRVGRTIVHAPIATALFSKSILTEMAKNAPQLSKMVYGLAQSSIFSWKDFFASIQSKGFKKFLPEIAGNSRKLLIGSKDFALCAIIKGPRGIHTLNVVDNILKCWISSYEPFLIEKAPSEADYADTEIEKLFAEVDKQDLVEIAPINDTFNEMEHIDNASEPVDIQEDASAMLDDREPGDDDSYSEYYPQYPEVDQLEKNDSTAHPPMPHDAQDDFEDSIQHEIDNKESSSEDTPDNSVIAEREIPLHADDGKEPSSLELPREPEPVPQNDEDIILKRLKSQEEIWSPPPYDPGETNDFNDDGKIGPPQPTDSVGMADTVGLGRTSEPPLYNDASNLEDSSDQTKDQENGEEEEVRHNRAAIEEDSIKKSLLSPRADESTPTEQETLTHAEEIEHSSEAQAAQSLEQEGHPPLADVEEDSVAQISQFMSMQAQLHSHLTTASNALKEYKNKALEETKKCIELLNKTVPIDAGHLLTAFIGAITAVCIVWLKDLLSRRQQAAARMTILTSPTAVIHARKSSAENDMNALGEAGGDASHLKGGACQSRRPARRSTRPKETTDSYQDATPASPRPRGRRASAIRSTSTSRSRSKSATATARTRQRAGSKASDAS